MFFILSKIGEFFVTPLHVALSLAAVGAALSFTRFAAKGRVLAALGVTALLLLSFTTLGELLLYPLENRFPQVADDAPAPDGIVVLGGAIDENLSRLRGGAALTEAGERVVAMVELARRYPAARLLFAGGSGRLFGAAGSEAEIVGRLLPQLGVEPGRVILEDSSRNTWENAVNALALARPAPGERWLLVTSASHMPRSMGIFRRVGFPVVAYPVNYHTGLRPPFSVRMRAADELKLVDIAAHEWVGLLAYRLTGKTDALFPEPEPGR
ncbi:YdcF family protein [Methylosinus sp. PW1]|uniref:YdcF family protein n=1 Tax=Methylosinus sp. PW1 TaxID=107636 RepID=UPI00055EEDF0|nr:YdcF family protein [Methylosinus sp. PW1]